MGKKLKRRFGCRHQKVTVFSFEYKTTGYLNVVHCLNHPTNLRDRLLSRCAIILTVTNEYRIMLLDGPWLRFISTRNETINAANNCFIFDRILEIKSKMKTEKSLLTVFSLVKNCILAEGATRVAKGSPSHLFPINHVTSNGSPDSTRLLSIKLLNNKNRQSSYWIRGLHPPLCC